MADKRTTIYDVAKRCGLSVATVSRVLSNAQYAVNEKTRQLVLQTAREMDYQPNFLGRYLKSDSTTDIGVLVPNLSLYSHVAMVEGIHYAMASSGYSALMGFSYYNEEHERQQFLSFLQKRVKGIILIAANANTDWLREMPIRDVPVVGVETKLSIPAPYVGFDYYESGVMAAEYLYSLGHRRMGVLSSTYIRDSRQQRFDGFVDGLRRHGIELQPSDIRVSDTLRGDRTEDVFALGQRLTEQLLDQPTRPTAIFAINDSLALGAIRTLRSYGLSVPQDMAVLGFGNHLQSRLTTPALSTVDQRAFDIGAEAVEQLFSRFDNAGKPFEDVMLSPRLVVRGTTGVQELAK